MFEKWLARFLRKKVGMFISGIHKNNLEIGFFPGTATIKKIGVKPELFQGLAVPGKLKFSWVEKLSVHVPWNVFGSKPVVITIEDVFVILESINDMKEAFEVLDERVIRQRLKFVNHMIKRFMNLKVKEKKEPELTERQKKIIDRIQVVIKNVHVRIEDPTCDAKYAFGFVLKEACTHNGEKFIHEGSEYGHDHLNSESVLKFANFKNAGMYWMSNNADSEFLANLTPLEAKQRMKAVIVQGEIPKEYPPGFVFIGSGYLTIKPKDKNDSNPEAPEVEIEIHPDPIHLELKRSTLETMTWLSLFYKRWWQFMWKRRASREQEVEACPFNTRAERNAEFKRLLEKVYSQKDGRKLDGMKKLHETLHDEREVHAFSKLSTKLSNEDIALDCKQAVEELADIKDHRKRSSLLRACHLKKSHHHHHLHHQRHGDAQHQHEVQLEPEDIEIMNKVAREIFGDQEEFNIENKKNVADAFRIMVKVKEGSFSLYNVEPMKNEGVVLYFQDLTLIAKKRYLDMYLKNVDLIHKVPGRADVDVLQSADKEALMKSEEAFFSLKFRRNVTEDEKKIMVEFAFDKAKIVYNLPVIMGLVETFASPMSERVSMAARMQQRHNVNDYDPFATMTTYKKHISMKVAPSFVLVPLQDEERVAIEHCKALIEGFTLESIVLKRGKHAHKKLTIGATSAKGEYLSNLDLAIDPKSRVREELLEVTGFDMSILQAIQLDNAGNKVLEMCRKDFGIHVGNVGIYIKPRIYLKMIKVFTKKRHTEEENLTPVVIKHESQLEVKEPEKREDLEKLPRKKAQMAKKFTMEIKSVFVVLPNPNPVPQSIVKQLVFKGGVSMHTETKPSPNIYRTIRESFERIDPEFSGEKRMSLDLKRMEMFICDPVEFLNVKAFNRVKKRYVLLPFSIQLSNKTRIKHDEEKDEFLVITKHNVVVEKLVLEIFYADILFVDENIKYQMAQIQEEGGFKREPKKAKKIEKIKDESVQEFDINSKGVQIVLVDNSEGFLAPALKLGIYDLQVSVAVTMPNKVLLQGKALLDGCFYNSLPCKWEPFLEKAGFRFECLAEENHKIHVELQNSEDTQTINLNVCDELLDIAQHLMKTWYVVGSTKRQKKKFDFNKSRIYRAMSKSLNKEEYAIDYISPYTIVNSTGFPIEVEAIYTNAPDKSSTTAKNPNLMKDTYHIQNGGATQFLVESERDGLSKSVVNSRSINANKIIVRIMHPTMKLDTIHGINIDKPRIRGYPITTTDTSTGQIVPLGDCYLHSVVEITRGKKIITLTSSMHITNKLNQAYVLVFEVFDQLLEVTLEPGEIVAVPINYIHQGTFLIKFGEEQRSQKVGFQTLLITQGQTAEFATGDSFVIAKAVKADEKCNFHEILLLPPLELKNCCRLRLFYRLFEDERDVYEENRSLNSDEIVQENNLSIRSAVYFQVRLQGYNWSNKIRIPESLSDSDRIEKIYMTDSRGTSFHLSMFVPRGGAGIRKVIFFAETCIINETPYELCYGQGGSKGEKFTLPGQTPIDVREPFDSKVLLYDNIDNMVICRPSYLEQSNPFGVKALGSRVVEMPNKTGTAMLELGVNTAMLTVDKENNVMTKVITVSPRYVFLNSTPYKMEVKSSVGGENPLMMIDKEGRCPLYWQEWTPGNKEKSILFRLRESAREEDYWLWSEKINLDTRGVNVCLVQTADRSDARVLRITVNSIPPITYITIEEERRGEMTFKHKPVEKLAIKNARQISIKADIKKLGLSVISSVGQGDGSGRKEILYLLFRGIDFKVAEDMMTKSLHLKLKYLNIDNNSYYHTPFPVLLTPADPRSLANNHENYFIEANIVQKLYSDITAFDLIHVKLGDSIMKLDNTFRNSVLNTVHNFFAAFTNQNLYASKKSLKLSLSSKAPNLKKKSASNFTEWGWMTVPYNTAMGPTLFIKQLKMEALAFSLSSRLDRKQTEQDIFNILDLAMSYQRLESAKSNSKLITLLKKITRKDIVSNDALLLQDAARVMAPLVSQLDTFSLNLKNISMRNAYDYPQDIAKVVASKYMTNAAKLVWRLFEAMGKQRVSKILNPDQNIINPLLEEEYRVQREKLQERRKACIRKIFGDDLDNIIMGKSVFKTPLKGDSDDIPAIEEKSFQDREEELEISRIFPLRRNTSEVIEDIYIALDEKANKHRIRLPRAFYGKERFYRDYIHCDAELYWLLQFLEGGRFKDISILRSFAGFYDEEDHDRFYMLVISFEKIIWWSAKDDNIVWTIDPCHIDRVDYAGRDGVFIHLKIQVENIQGMSVQLKNHDKIKNRLIYEELAILLGYRRKNYLA